MMKTSADVYAALRDRFRDPEFALLFEVRNGTGYQRRERYADALAMSLWPSRGLELHGIEVKASRSDWLSEKANPEKSAEIQRFCNRWWLAVSDEKIVAPGELPPTWGLLVPRGSKLVAKVEAPQLTAEPITRAFLASVLRNAARKLTDSKEVDAIVERRVEDARKSFEESSQYERTRLKEEADDLRRKIIDFESAAGITIRGWDRGKIGAAVKLVLSGGIESQRRELERMAEEASSIAQSIKTVLEGVA